MERREPFLQSLLRLPSEIWQTAWPAAALLSLVVWVVFGQAIPNELTFDDLDTIKYNQAIRSLRNLPILFSKDYFRLSDEYTYRPVVTLSYFFDRAIIGKNPAIYHIHNVALHHANVLLVFLLFNLLGLQRWRSFAIALLFAVHPLHTEAVLFPGFREDVQMTLGLLVMSCCLAADRRQLMGWWVFGASLALAFALFAKEGALLLPAAWLAFDAIHNRTDRRQLALRRRYGLLLLVLIFYGAIRFLVMTNPNAAAMDVIDRLPLKERLLTAPYLFAYYVRRFLWPTPLCIIHEIEALRGIGPTFYISLLVSGAIAALWIGLAQREKWVWLVGLWLLATFAPVANIYQIVNLWAERFYYVVGVGMSAIFVAGLGALWDRLSKRMETNRRFAFAIIIWILVGLLAWMAALCDLKRILECRTSLLLWRTTVRCVPTNGSALTTLAIYELEAGNIPRAEQIALEAAQHDGGEYRVNFILGQAAFRRQKWDEAMAYFEKALTVPPPSLRSRAELVLSLAHSYLKAGQSAKAATLLHQAIEQDPENRTLHDLLRQIEPKSQDSVSTSPAVSAKD